MFCRIISGELPSVTIIQSRLSVAFMDIRPVNAGHALMIPRRHVASFTDLTSAEVEDLMSKAQEVARGLRAIFPDHEGITLSLADGVAAGQDVPHAHLHVIPRQQADEFGWRRFGLAVDLERLEILGGQLRAAIGSGS